MVKLFDERGRFVSTSDQDLEHFKFKPRNKYKPKPKLTKLQIKNKKIIAGNRRLKGKFTPNKGRYQSPMQGLSKHASVFCQLKGKRSQRKAF